jgi:hypothetical protein
VSILELFSKRQMKLRGDVPDVYTYDDIPNALRVQIVHIWNDALGGPDQVRHYPRPLDTYRFIVDGLCREYGIFRLPGGDREGGPRDYYIELATFLLNERDTERVLDAIELSFRAIDFATREGSYLPRMNASGIADEAIADLNARFREHGIGYQYASGEIVRVDSEFLHTEAVKPALLLLRDTDLEGAQAEFLTAHDHYRHGRTKEALNECLKALESTIKTICKRRKWQCDPNAPAKALLQVIFDKGLIPAFWQQHFTGLRITLEAGVPTVRNKLGGHGQGPQVVEVPPHVVAYALHLTASAIVFLAESERVLH